MRDKSKSRQLLDNRGSQRRKTSMTFFWAKRNQWIWILLFRTQLMAARTKVRTKKMFKPSKSKRVSLLKTRSMLNFRRSSFRIPLEWQKANLCSISPDSPRIKVNKTCLPHRPRWSRCLHSILLASVLSIQPASLELAPSTRNLPMSRRRKRQENLRRRKHRYSTPTRTSSRSL